jgi:hypothetical protein
MNIENLVAVTGLPGLHKIVANRDNGLIVEDLETKKTRFCSSRKHQFSPMETIAIFTDDNDSEQIEKVFQSMLDQKAKNPVPAPKASAEDLKTYFEKILPNFDRDKVHVSHIKKVIKWYNQLDKTGLLTAEAPVKEKKEGAEGKSETKSSNTKKTAAPKKAKPTKTSQKAAPTKTGSARGK